MKRLKYFFRFLILSIALISFSVTAFSFEGSKIINSWKTMGYSIIEEDLLKIVELSFDNSHVISLNESEEELYVITYLSQSFEKPDSTYLEDIHKVLINSSFSQTMVDGIIQKLSFLDNWQETFFVRDSIKVELFLYDQTTPILKLNVIDEEIIEDETIKQDEEKEASEILQKFDQVETENNLIKTENEQLNIEKQMLINQMSVLEKLNQTLKEDAEKYQQLSVYKDKTISGLKSTLDWYIGIEKQKNETIKTLKAQIRKLEDEIIEKENEYQESLQKMNDEIEILELTVKRKSIEIEGMKDSQKQLLERLDNFKKLDEQESPQPIKETISEEKEKQKVKVEPSTENRPVETEKTNNEQIEEEYEEVLDKPEKEEVETDQPQEEYRPVLNKIIVYNEGKQTYTINNHYDENGKLIKESMQAPEGKTIAVTETKYNDNELVKEKITKEASEIIGKTLFQYDKKGRILRVFSYNQESLVHYSLYEYDNLISENDPVKIKYYRDNKLDAFDENEFNEKGQMIKTIQKDSNGMIINQVVYEYLENRLIKSSSFRFGEKIGYQIFHYNEKGLKTSQENYNGQDQLISKMVFIWDGSI